MSNCKYYKRKKQVSYDSGQTWSDVSPAEYQVGELYQMDSQDCSEIGIIRWVVVLGDYLCDGKDKYVKEIEQYSTDGVIWRNVYPATYRKGTLIEANSSLCNYKWEGHYSFSEAGLCGISSRYIPGVGCVPIDPVKIIQCSASSSTTLTLSEIYYDPYKLLYGYIGDCVTSIDNGSFTWMDGLTGVSIPNTVTSIGNWAFSYCSALSSITIPDSVTTVGNMLFYGCTSLQSVILPNSISAITDQMFEYCGRLSSVNIPDSVTSIGASAFTKCSSLTEITIPSGVTSIGNAAFSGCSSMTKVTIEATTPPTNGGSMFNNKCMIYVPCDSISDYITTWSEYCYNFLPIQPCNYQNKALLTYLDGYMHNIYCDSYSRSELITNETDMSINYRKEYLVDAVIGSCTTSLGKKVFDGCSRLTGVTIPSTVTSIGEQAFSSCHNLSSITIPDSVTSIGIYAFLGCDGITSAGPNGSGASLTIPSGLTIISQGCFQGCDNLTSVNIPNGVTYISYYAFQDCPSLSSVTIPNSVTSILPRSFANCTSLVRLDIPDSVTSIESGVCSGCTSLSSVTMPSGITSICAYTFVDCTSLTSIDIPDRVTKIDTGACSGCTSLTSVTIGSGVKTISDNTFMGCTSLVSIDIPSGVTTIGRGAFSGCSSMTSITENAVTPPSLYQGAFDNTNDCPIYVPAGSVETYKSRNNWASYKNRIQAIPT